MKKSVSGIKFFPHESMMERIINGNSHHFVRLSTKKIPNTNRKQTIAPTYTGPASPIDGLCLRFFSVGADMNFNGNGKAILKKGDSSGTTVINVDSGCEMIFSATVDAYLIMSLQGTLT